MKKLSIILAAIILSGCSTSHDRPILYSDNSAETSLDWGGVYKGVLPCADCEGIDTTLTLNYDGTYVLDSAYKKGKLTTIPQAMTGRIIWDKQRPVIYLKDNHEQRIFFVGEGYVKAYDMEGNPIDSKLNYTLKQVTNENKNLDSK